MNLKINNEGWVYFVCSILISIIVLPFFNILGIFFVIVSIFIFYFFRDPIRSIPNNNVIVSPGDGKLVFVGESEYPEETNINKKALKISIFLSIFDVHVNRIPTSGTVKKIIYVPVKFFNASYDKSSKQNERNIVIIEIDKKENFVVSQIAGLIARRIVCNLNVKQQVIKGDRYGITISSLPHSTIDLVVSQYFIIFNSQDERYTISFKSPLYLVGFLGLNFPLYLIIVINTLNYIGLFIHGARQFKRHR